MNSRCQRAAAHIKRPNFHLNDLTSTEAVIYKFLTAFTPAPGWYSPFVDIGRMLGLLERLYGHLPLPPRDPFGFCVWEVLSHQAPPRQADAALHALKRLRALTPDAMHRAPPGKIQSAVALTGSCLDSRLQRHLRYASNAAFRRRLPGFSDRLSDRASLPQAERRGRVVVAAAAGC